MTTIWMMALAALVGVVIGALIVVIAFNLRIRYEERRDIRRRMLEHKTKEIETILLLNQKIQEILQKRAATMSNYVSFDSFDDVYITIDDYVFLQSFAAQNNFYLPNYIVEEFFKQISQRKVILSPEDTIAMGGYAYKGARVLLEQFSDSLLELVRERKVQLKKLASEELTYLK
ncbi:hypothetical protein P7G51_01580 [Enterococcus asini]|uniref:hypothetical protein n=1 Tax=Enterococcus TaxID=1350 RepID=UPI00288E343F|nr:hypothetical protein [Enterococcus asini]MDT2756079.1 hypothetical protein [Enterococcus asini]